MENRERRLVLIIRGDIMGWDCAYYKNKKECVDFELRQLEWKGRKVLKYKSTAQGMYAVVDCPEFGVFLACTMIKKYKGEYQVKAMTEEMGPAMNDCPTSLFELLPEPKGYAEGFRAACRANEERKQWTPEYGEVVSIYGKKYKVGMKVNRTSYGVYCLETGKQFKSPKNKMEKVG